MANTISCDEKRGILRLDTKNTTYAIGITDGLYLGHLYYGPRIAEEDFSVLSALARPMSPLQNRKEMCIFMDGFDYEYPGWGVGDEREGALRVRDEQGITRTNLFYKGHRISSAKIPVPGLPSTFGAKDDVQTLEVDLEDPDTGLFVTLFYSVFAECDVIARRVEIRNTGKGKLVLERALSCSIDMQGRDREGRAYQLLTFYGIWAREFTQSLRPIGFGKTGVSSICGKTGNRAQPFLGLLSEGATQYSGDVYGWNFLYSGNFTSTVEKSFNETLRISMGINPEGFSWTLNPGDVFYAPEVVMTFSAEGISGMTHHFHDLFRKHLIRGKYKDRKRPILINNWEATYFDFNTQKLLDIARTAHDCGIEMLVMDDGWFGKRNDPDSSLGDWYVNEEKLPGGLKYLGDELEKMGMKFGIWFEPEMISPDSDLYRTHPDWAIQVPGREPALSRNQLVLDVSRADVREYILESVSKILKSAKIAYVKWDMNRYLSDLFSAELPPERQGELMHRYVLGVYELQERLLQAFPDLLLENCSSGGARFDPGMLFYSPQIWTSDDTDAYERLHIQEGAAMLYPLSCLGAHVSICPNHVTGRVVPFETRGNVALAGTFGYELDITKLSGEEKELIKKQVALFHRFNDLIREGDYYRMYSFQDTRLFDCYGVASKDKSEMLLTMVHVLNQPCNPSRRIHIHGLAADKLYRVTEVGSETCSDAASEADPDAGEASGSGNFSAAEVLLAHGSALENIGIQMPCRLGDFQSVLYHIVEVAE